MPEEELPDEYVANLLKAEAKAKSDKYSLIGLEAFVPKKSYEQTPKPNKNFLRNIIRDTDNHNAALLAKENAEAQAKLRTLTGEEGTDSLRSERYSKEDHNRHRKRKRSEDRDRKRSLSHDRRRSRRHRERRDASEERRHYHRKKHHGGAEESQEEDSHHRRHKRRRHHEDDNDTIGRERHRNKRRRQYEDESGTEHHSDHHKRRRNLDEKRPEEEHRSRHSRRHYDRKDRDSNRTSDSESNQKYHKRKSRHENEESRYKHKQEPEKGKPSKKRPDRETRGESFYRQISPNDIVQSIEFSCTPVPQGNGNSQPKSVSSETETDRHLTDHAGSELLEEIFGPCSPQTTPKDVKTKGRGNFSSAAMDARFAEDYDPSMEIQMDTDQNELEAMRDRQQWRLRGADRLRAAGFSEDVIKIWQNGGEKQERNVEDVKWTKQGEAREWDRGKVVDEEGDVDLKPKWGEVN